MSLKEWDNLGLTKNEQYTFTAYAEALRKKGFDSATTETMKFLDDFNHFVKETEEVGTVPTRVNRKKMFTSSGEKDKKYWKTLKSGLDKVSADKLNASIEKIQILTKYEKDVCAFLKSLVAYAREPLDTEESEWAPAHPEMFALGQIQLVDREKRDALGLNALAVCAAWTKAAWSLFMGVCHDDGQPRDGKPTQAQVDAFKKGAEKIKTQSSKVLSALENRQDELENAANSIYTSSQKVTDEQTARWKSVLLREIGEAKRNPSKKIIISIMNLVKKQAPVGLGAVADQVIAALNTAGHSPAPTVVTVSRSSRSTKPTPASVAPPPLRSVTQNMNPSVRHKRSDSPNNSDISDSSSGSRISSRLSADRSNSPGSNQRPANRNNSPGSNGNSNKTKKKKSSFRPKITPV